MKSFLDMREAATPDRFDADICIIGAGAAGITLAREFIGTDTRVCVLEAGGMSVDPAVTANSVIEDAGRPYQPNEKRLRLFGGTTNHWMGQCGPLMPIDFEKRDWIPHSGWPYSLETLEPYYRRAHQVLRLGDYDYDPQSNAAQTGLDLFPFDPSVVETAINRYQRVRFGLEYGNALSDAENIDVLLYADVSDIRLGDDLGDTVSHVTAQNISGRKFSVHAKHFVVAVGGVETPRLLLMCNSQRTAGLGNHSDVVGRFFMEHIWFESGFIAPPGGALTSPLYMFEIPLEETAVRGHLTLPEETLRTEKLSSYRAEIETMNPNYNRAARLKSGDIRIDDVVSLVTDPVGLGHVMSCGYESAPTAYKIANYFEQVPNPSSRVTLADNMDSLGRPQTKLEWRLSRQDHDTVVKAQEILAREVGRSGIGRMNVEIEPDPEVVLPGSGGGAHHMGTARMSDDPKSGVIDGHAQVHNINNLHIAGSSIFPTVGWINPTMTIVATTLKLADRLKLRLSQE